MSLGAPLQRLAHDATQFVTEWPREGAAIIQRSVQSELRSAPGGGSVSGVGAATVTVEAGAGDATVSGTGTMRLWSWYENGTSAHVVNARPGGWLRTPYGPRRRVHVSGWRAERTWTNGVERADPLVVRDAEARFARLGA